jgi:hypothetical protein
MNKLPVVGMFGNPGGILLSARGLDDAIKRVGENTGNLMFQYASWSLVRNPVALFQINELEARVSELRETIDVLMIPAANQLNPAWDCGWLANLIERLDKPVVIVGLGAQSKIGQDTDIILPPGTERYVKVLSERARVIGVRGATTQNLLARYGVTNTIITGCPSNFIRPGLVGEDIAQRLGATIAKAKAGEPLALNYLFGTMEDYTRDAERTLYGILGPVARRIIYQTNAKILRYLNTGTPDDAARSFLGWEAGVLKEKGGAAQHIQRVGEKGCFFMDAKTWIDAVASDDASIGMRIHGAVAALQGGSLGVCVAFDARTQELVDTMGYPYIPANSLAGVQNLAQLFELVRFSPEGFDRQRRVLRNNLCLALEQFGIRTLLSDRPSLGAVGA